MAEKRCIISFEEALKAYRELELGTLSQKQGKSLEKFEILRCLLSYFDVTLLPVGLWKKIDYGLFFSPNFFNPIKQTGWFEFQSHKYVLSFQLSMFQLFYFERFRCGSIASLRWSQSRHLTFLLATKRLFKVLSLKVKFFIKIHEMYQIYEKVDLWELALLGEVYFGVKKRNKTKRS